MIPDRIVPGDSFPPVSTADGMITIAVAVLKASRAGAFLVIHRAA